MAGSVGEEGREGESAGLGEKAARREAASEATETGMGVTVELRFEGRGGEGGLVASRRGGGGGEEELPK